MKLVSWNVNGLRACLKRDFLEACATIGADILCLQETKLTDERQLDVPMPYPYRYWNHSVARKGYSGTVVLTREEPLSVSLGIGQERHDQEGRVITAEFPAFTLVNVYTPNSQDALRRLSYRMEWEDDFRAYLHQLDTARPDRPVIVCGDMNVAHEEIDIARPGPNRRNAGFTDEERAKFTKLMGAGFADTFRRLYPDRHDAYSWWSYQGGARARNVGWRIDYFVVSERMLPKVKDAVILPEVEGSDHCPVGLLL